MIIARKNYPMKSDVREKDNMYVLEVNLPGFKKEDIKAHVDNGNLIITASQEKETERNKKNYIRKERYSGQYQRSFYIGHSIKQEDIKASYKWGVLKLEIPKENKEAKKNVTQIKIA
ncbi:MAG: Hsp20/alpha crystallin family protein [bacterium]|nr:Hsp20/alpha crystallin family protein [bacterium]